MQTPVRIGPELDALLVEALYHVRGKAEIIEHEIVPLPVMTGHRPGNTSFLIAMSLHGYVKRTKRGFVVHDNVACLVSLPLRKSFSPDAGYHLGPDPGMKFFTGAPVFAAEVRSEGDYGLAAEHLMADKRRDYFEAGSLVVWDVDLQGRDVIVRVFKHTDPDQPAAVFRRGETADAEPAVPGWTLPVDDLFG